MNSSYKEKENVVGAVWQPIETAPLDVPILGWNKDYDEMEVVIWGGKEYWISNLYYEFGTDGYDRNITHWMPLPEPPIEYKVI